MNDPHGEWTCRYCLGDTRFWRDCETCNSPDFIAARQARLDHLQEEMMDCYQFGTVSWGKAQ